MPAAVYESGPNIGLVVFVIVAAAAAVIAIIDALLWPACAFYGENSDKTASVIVPAGATVLGIGVFLGAWKLLGAGPTVKQQTSIS